MRMHTSVHACVHTHALQGKTANQNSERVVQIKRQRNHGISTTQLPTIKSLSSGLTATSKSMSIFQNIRSKI